MHALIIEPQIFTAFMIEDTLREIGYMSISIAVCEQEAVSSAAARPPDLITAAVRLSEGCGVAAVQAICRRRDTRVVFITQRVAEVRRRMPSAVIARKPLSSAVLRSAIAQTAGPQAEVAQMLHAGGLRA